MFNLSLLYKVLLLFSLVLAIKSKQLSPEEFVASALGWNYQEIHGWKEHFSTCAGEQQSPINLRVSKAKKVPYSRFTFGNYNKVYPKMVTNNGYTAQFNLVDSPLLDRPFIMRGGLKTRFIFEQLHFHWGLHSSKGSEHRIDGQSFAAELHLVHYNSKYANFTDAVPHSDGLAVLGIFLQLSPRDNPGLRHLEEFDGVHDASEKNKTLPYPVPLADLLPLRTDSFFRYNGSLTVPACNENVIWTVFDTPITISERQLNKFRKLKNNRGRPLGDNFRPVQMLHDRVVTYRARNPNQAPTNFFRPVLVESLLPSIPDVSPSDAGRSLILPFGTQPSIPGNLAIRIAPEPMSPLPIYPFFAGDSTTGISPFTYWFTRYLKPYFDPQYHSEHF